MDLEDDPFARAWESHARAAELRSPLDQRARDFGVFYFGLGDWHKSITYAAAEYGCDWETATRHLKRLSKMGWVETHAQPMKAGELTLPRVYSRKVFWSTNYWRHAHIGYAEAGASPAQEKEHRKKKIRKTE